MSFFNFTLGKVFSTLVHFVQFRGSKVRANPRLSYNLFSVYGLFDTFCPILKLKQKVSECIISHTRGAIMELFFQSSQKITVATNTFINVPVILKYEDTPLIEVVKEQNIAFTTQIPIYHSDGTYLAKVKGNRVYPTEAGKKANIEIRDAQDRFICRLDNKVMF